MQEKGGGITKHPLEVTFSLLRIFRLFTCTESNVSSVISVGTTPTNLLTLLFYVSHISWYSRLMDLNIYLKIQ